MTDIIRLDKNDYDEAIDFLNLVFSMSGTPHDFARLLPKLYASDTSQMPCHFAIRRGGRIRALVGSFPMTLMAAGHELKIAGIGSVATHPSDRGSGYMRRLMRAALEDMRSEGVSLSVLGGQRQRYNYYGYEKAGTVLKFNIGPANIRHSSIDDSSTIRFVNLGSNVADMGSRQSSEFSAFIYELHSSQLFHVQREPEALFAILCSWNSTIWVATDLSGKPLGYLVIGSSGDITEFLVADSKYILPVVSAWINNSGQGAVICLQPWQNEQIVSLSSVCESWHWGSAYQYRIFNWPSVLTAFLQLKTKITCLPEGTICFALTDADRSCKIALSNKNITCSQTHEKPDIYLDQLTAIRLFLGPAQPCQVLDQSQLPDLAKLELLNSWFPLPVGWSDPDGV